MRNISFSLTTPQFIDGTKDVTRRLGWTFLKAGDRLMAVKKAMGLRKGEKMEQLGEIEILSVSREPLCRLIEEPKYGDAELRREGFAGVNIIEWVRFFCESHGRCVPEKIVTRIEFRKVA